MLVIEEVNLEEIINIGNIIGKDIIVKRVLLLPADDIIAVKIRPIEKEDAVSIRITGI